MNYNILLCKIDHTKPINPGEPIPFSNVYTIATATTEAEALRKSQYYSALYQKKGLYHVIRKPSHIVTYKEA
jgi:hypothetical protein